jgi:hypothetical protein
VSGHGSCVIGPGARIRDKRATIATRADPPNSPQVKRFVPGTTAAL